MYIIMFYQHVRNMYRQLFFNGRYFLAVVLYLNLSYPFEALDLSSLVVCMEEVS